MRNVSTLQRKVVMSRSTAQAGYWHLVCYCPSEFGGGGHGARADRRAPEIPFKEGASIMGLILLIVVILLLFGGGGGYYAYNTWGPQGGIGIVGIVLIIIVALFVMRGRF
jgi:hypothetical protein